MIYLNYTILSQFLSSYKMPETELRRFNALNKQYNFNLKHDKYNQIVSMARRINYRQVKYAQIRPQNDKNSKTYCHYTWVFGEYKIFLWTILILMMKYSVQIAQISDEQLEIILIIFPSKNLHFIKYSLQFIVNQSSDIAAIWDTNQWQLLKEIINQMKEDQQNINWKDVSFFLYCRSNCKYFKIVSKCRQKWMNHINPQVKKDKWQIEEDIRLFQLIQQYGYKWSKISHAMAKIRTQHMVKNRFNYYIRKWSKPRHISKDQAMKIFKQTIRKPYFWLKQNANKLISQPNPDKVQLPKKETIQNNLQNLIKYHPNILNKFIQQKENEMQLNSKNELMVRQEQDDRNINSKEFVDNQQRPIINEVKIQQKTDAIIVKEEIIEVKSQHIEKSIPHNPQMFPTDWIYYPFINCYLPKFN